MLLIVSNKLDPHTDIIVQKLYEQKMSFFRWNLEDFLISHSFEMAVEHGKVQKMEVSAEERTIDLMNQASVVWYRRPGTLVASEEIANAGAKDFCVREGQFALNNVWRLLEDKVWINNPYFNQRLENKLYQLKLAEEIGLETPPSVLTNNPSAVIEFKRQYGEIIAKTISAGFINDGGRKTIYSHKVSDNDLSLMESVRYAPTLFQAYIPKKLELRITVVEDKIFACAIESQKSEKTKDDWRRYDFDNVPHYPYELSCDMSQKLVQFVECANLKFGTFDMILTPDERYVFLEINPNGQWFWIERLTGLEIADSLVTLFKKYEQ